ncbi:hypothetical protein AB0M20_44680 [Actinoplanes sp. NPDC051633]|uniref:hypothetical protein n=1 Tax=Actinoplanes sp. NPDC051633 TaxID=3155670 RepID=UPI003419CE85
MGRLDVALGGVALIARRTPTPETLLDYAQLLRVAGRAADADRQLELADAAHRIFRANGGRDDLAGAQIALAKGDPATAVRLAEAEFGRRPFAEVADTLGRALHAAGRDREALGYARRAASGSPDAAYAYHLATVALALGDRPTALKQLRRVRDSNRYFSPADGPTAARALAALEASS